VFIDQLTQHGRFDELVERRRAGGCVVHEVDGGKG
jgi:hypothetical protein